MTSNFRKNYGAGLQIIRSHLMPMAMALAAILGTTPVAHGFDKQIEQFCCTGPSPEQATPELSNEPIIDSSPQTTTLSPEKSAQLFENWLSEIEQSYTQIKSEMALTLLVNLVKLPDSKTMTAYPAFRKYVADQIYAWTPDPNGSSASMPSMDMVINPSALSSTSSTMIGFQVGLGPLLKMAANIHPVALASLQVAGGGLSLYSLFYISPPLVAGSLVSLSGTEVSISGASQFVPYLEEQNQIQRQEYQRYRSYLNTEESLRIIQSLFPKLDRSQIIGELNQLQSNAPVSEQLYVLFGGLMKSENFSKEDDQKVKQLLAAVTILDIAKEDAKRSPAMASNNKFYSTQMPLMSSKIPHHDQFNVGLYLNKLSDDLHIAFDHMKALTQQALAEQQIKSFDFEREIQGLHDSIEAFDQEKEEFIQAVNF